MKDLPDLYNRRLKACNKLESAETSLIGTALKLHNANLKAEAKNGGVEMKGSDELQDREKALSLAERLVPANERPSHRLPVGFIPFGLPLIGKKVDSIEWARKEIEETTIALEKGRTVLRQEEESSTTIRGKVGGFAGLVTGLDVPIPLRGGLLHRRSDVDDLDLDNERARPSTSTEQVRRRGAGAKVSVESSHAPEAEATGSGEADASNIRLASQDDETYPPLNSAFVLFHQQIAAHMAAQSLTHHEPYRMAAKYTEVAPADVIWGNLGLNPYETKVRLVISYAVTVGLIIVWAIPGMYHSSLFFVPSFCEERTLRLLLQAGINFTDLQRIFPQLHSLVLSPTLRISAKRTTGWRGSARFQKRWLVSYRVFFRPFCLRCS